MLNVNNVNPKINLTLLGKIVFLIFFSIKIGSAQDIHYSQYYNAILNVNPAKTGVFNGDQRLMASYKDQWSSIPVPWTTFSLAYDQKFYPKASTSYFFSGGLNLNYDRQGLSQLTLTNINVLGSYTRVINPNNLVTIGASIGYASRGFSLTNLSWDQQWTGDVFDPTLPAGENFDSRRVSFVENSIGINYRWQKSNRTKVDIGAGLFHFIEPPVAYYNNDATKLPRRLSLTGIASLKIVNPLDIQVHVMSQFQGDYRETLYGGLLKFHINQQRGKEFEFHLGGGYRTSGSILPSVAIRYNQFYGSFSYDIDVSDFDANTNNKGGPELHFRYIITKVRPSHKFKICPIF